jgi:maltose O-acetyltransferase
MLAGAGTIRFLGGVILGWEQSQGFLAGYSYIEAREPQSIVSIGEGSHLNNGVMIVSEGTSVSIGRRCLIGPAVQIFDSDFHALEPSERRTAPPRQAPVDIGDDVFIGASAIILKGVTVGDGSVIGAGAVVVTDVPAATVVGGNPAGPVRR